METIIRIENGKIYTKSILCEDEDIFEIVEKIPEGFFIWNIGENMGSDAYIPLCQDLHPEDKDEYHLFPILKNLGRNHLLDPVYQQMIDNEIQYQNSY